MGTDHETKPQAGSVYSWAGLESDAATVSDFPLTGNCASCGRFIVRDAPAAPWRHRCDDEPLPVEPSSGGWLGMLRVAGHEITPQAGSAFQEKNRQPASLLDVSHYPVLATCLECGGQIRCERMYLAPWTHVPEIPPQRLARCQTTGDTSAPPAGAGARQIENRTDRKRT